ncbi:MAG: hypothetical protein ACRC14_14220 [Paracoccaceae bacterium]
MEPSRAQILEWLEGRLGRTLTTVEQSDVLAASGHDGDDAVALIKAFGAQFGVDLGPYRGDMHHAGEGGLWHPTWPVPASSVHGVRVPISVTLLQNAAAVKTWPVTYPNLARVRDLSWANIPILLCGLPIATLCVLWIVRQLS